MSSELRISEEIIEDATIVKLSGEVDIYTSQNLKEKLYKVIDATKSDIVICCKELNYIDSTGLGIFIGALKKAKQYESTIVIRDLKDNIKKLFVITGLDKLFVIE